LVGKKRNVDREKKKGREGDVLLDSGPEKTKGKGGQRRHPHSPFLAAGA